MSLFSTPIRCGIGTIMAISIMGLVADTTMRIDHDAGATNGFMRCSRCNTEHEGPRGMFSRAFPGGAVLRPAVMVIPSGQTRFYGRFGTSIPTQHRSGDPVMYRLLPSAILADRSGSDTRGIGSGNGSPLLIGSRLSWAQAAPLLPGAGPCVADLLPGYPHGLASASQFSMRLQQHCPILPLVICPPRAEPSCNGDRWNLSSW
jgi:hypothetical protein